MDSRIGNVVFDAPWAGDGPLYARTVRKIADLYGALLGKRVRTRAEVYREANYPADEGDEVDLIVSGGEDGVGIAFELQTEGYEPPRWPDPAYPQQMHLDVFVPDIDTAELLVLEHGATKLADAVYADAGGHPFCLCHEPTVKTSRIGRIVFDCFSPRSLAAFWADFMGMPVRVEDTPTRVVVAREGGALPMLAFQHSLGQGPRWPDPCYPEQVHLDIANQDQTARDAAVERALRLGAIQLHAADAHDRVYADPAGHPFCL